MGTTFKWSNVAVAVGMLISACAGAVLAMCISEAKLSTTESSAAWAGSAAAWAGVLVAIAAATATVWAIRVSLHTAEQATRVAIAIRQSEVYAEDVRNASLRARMSVIFRNELFMLASQFDYVLNAMKVQAAAERWDHVFVMFGHAPTKGLTLLQRFSGELHAFPPEVGGHLMYALWRFNSELEAPPREAMEPDQVRQAFITIQAAWTQAINDYRKAYLALKPYLPPNVSPISASESAFESGEPIPHG